MGSVAALDYPTEHGIFRVSPRSFFQVNRFLIDSMIDRALESASGASALDLYAGAGLFAIPLARKFESVTAVEAGSSAARDLDVNAARAGVTVRIEQNRVEDFLAKFAGPVDFVLADPPRSGLGKSVVADLKRLAPPRITIVSCDPATLARDLAGLGYQIDRITLVDLFPQTYHIESISWFVR
jgi:23S rRNA (uracil1939-C5)-methyltransferase